MNGNLMMGAVVVALVACTPSGNSEETLDLATWAARTCGIMEARANELATASQESPGGVTAMSLEARKRRAAALIGPRVSALKKAHAELTSYKGPGPTSELQSALATANRKMADALQEVGKRIANADDLEDIEAANAQFSIVFESGRRAISEAIEDIPPHVDAALGGVTKCGH